MPTYINNIVALADLESAKVAHSPMSHTIPVLEPFDNPDRSYPYSTMIGRLLWLARCCRSDITFSVNLLARFTTCYGPAHISALKRIFRYIAYTSEIGITFDGNAPLDILAYSDADYGSQHGRKSVSGCLVFLGKSLIAMASKKQKSVSTSTMEAEFQALALATSELLWLQNFLEGLGMPRDRPSTILVDNQAVINHLDNPTNRSLAKHIDIKFHFVRDYYKNKQAFDIGFVATKDNLADALTKPLPYPQHWYLANSYLGIHATDSQWSLGWHFPFSYWSTDVSDYSERLRGLRGSVEDDD
ncbi:Reverse transcriptase (RNA-dependent DNA polymerase) [Ceratobasidium sp. AG-Ba]|nr:Reverse transcriptase (RNA-dependent DNA polymerase) [Ceratobasidium sp. AG-Ba]QRW07698.1 hypothetical protein RhiLY_06697 [Ceratobasidium sp. AG-Ba]